MVQLLHILILFGFSSLISAENICDKKPCHHYATCTWKWLSPYYACTCYSGFEGDGHTCVDIHICEKSHTCGPNAFCKYYPGGKYECICYTGYGPNLINNYGCVDVNECENPKICGVNNECQNTNGSYECRCLIGYESNPSGYIGNPGVNCIDINECMNPETCGVNAECQNTISSYECRCLVGYEGNPRVNCTDINECVNQSSCDVLGATCVNQPGTYECVCPPGSNTDSTGQCTDIDSENTFGIEVIVAIIGVTLAVVILVTCMIVGIHKRKRRQEQAQNLDLTYENLDNGRLPTPEPWNTYSTPAVTEEPMYSEPVGFQASSVSYAIPVPKSERQVVPNEYVEVGDLAQPDYTAIEAEGPLYDYACLPQPMYSQIQRNSSTSTQDLPKPLETNYTQFVPIPKSLPKKLTENNYVNVPTYPYLNTSN